MPYRMGSAGNRPSSPAVPATIFSEKFSLARIYLQQAPPLPPRMINSRTTGIWKSTATLPMMGYEPGEFGLLFVEKNPVDMQKMEERNRY
jgi:hypothetical protein